MTTPLCFSPPILPLTPSPPLSTSHEFKKPHLVIRMCSKVCNHLLEYKYPFKATSLKKNDCLPPRCDHLPIASKLGMGLDNTLPVHAGILACSCADLVYAVATFMSSCEQQHCYVCQIFFCCRHLLPLAFIVSTPPSSAMIPEH